MNLKHEHRQSGITFQYTLMNHWFLFFHLLRVKFQQLFE